MSAIVPEQTDRRVLILPSSPEGGQMLQRLLADVGVVCEVCGDAVDMRDRLAAGAGALLLAEEMLDPHAAGPLVEHLCQQPRWSDLPILLLSQGQGQSSQVDWATSCLDNVTLLDEPVHAAALQSAVRAALRARLRQYEMRNHLAQRDRVEEELRASEERFRAYFELAVVGIAEADAATGRFVRVNDRYCQITGYSREELLSMRAGDITHPDDRQDTVRLFDRMTGGQVPEYSLEKRYIRKDGRIVWVQLHVTPIHDDHGRTAYTFGVIQDITERKATEQAVQHERTFLREVIDADPSLVFVKDRQGRFVLCNEALARIYGSTVDDVQGKTDADFNADIEEVRHFRHDDLEVMDTRRVKLIPEEKVSQPDGQEHWMSTVKVPLVSEDGTCNQVLGVAIDITQRRQAEEQLRALNATLEQRVVERTAEAQQRAEQLSVLAAELTMAEQRERQRLAQVLHDHLQQLLVGARFNVLMLRTQPDIPQMEQPLQQIADLLDESLRTSRSLTAELSPPVLHQGSLADVLQWLAGWVQDTHGLRVQVEVDEQVNPPAEQIRLLLFQASRELLFNIVKHAGVHEARMEMARLDGEQLRIVISDAGRGFEPARLAGSARGAGGFGLLSIRERLLLLGGHLHLDSAVGRGTRATLIAPMQVKRAGVEVLPAEVVGPCGRPSDTLPPERAPLAAGRDQIRVLLADDHKVVRDGLARLLQTCEGIEVIAQASDGQEAVELARRVRPDVVIMDVSMPKMSGVEATRLLHEEMPEMHVIGLSMHVEPHVAEAMTTAGAVAYLTKTAPPELLINAVRASRQPT